MSRYFNAAGELLECDDALFAAWIEAGNPKADGWQVQPPAPPHDPTLQALRWDGAAWIVEDRPVIVPEQVPAHHMRRALRAFGLLTVVNSYMDALPDDAPMRDDWEYAPYLRRDAAGIETARVALGITTEQVDALFVAAAAVQT
jgi:hypothetical protein